MRGRRRLAGVRVLDAESVARGAATSLLREACDEASRLAGVDADRAWAWATVERVTTGLYLHWFGHHEEGEPFLALADVLPP